MHTNKILFNLSHRICYVRHYEWTAVRLKKTHHCFTVYRFQRRGDDELVLVDMVNSEPFQIAKPKENKKRRHNKRPDAQHRKITEMKRAKNVDTQQIKKEQQEQQHQQQQHQQQQEQQQQQQQQQQLQQQQLLQQLATAATAATTA